MFKVEHQIMNSKDAQAAINKDLNMKDEAFGIDQICYVTHNNSSELALHSGIERVDQVLRRTSFHQWEIRID